MTTTFRYHTIPVTPFAQNCSIVWCDATKQAAVIDPGGDLPRIEAAVQQLGVDLKQIWLTHAHIDHAGGTAELSARLSLPIIGPHPGDQFWIDGIAEQGRMFGFPQVAKRIAERAKAAGVEKVAFDRAGFAYHGRVKALADAAREAGLQF